MLNKLKPLMLGDLEIKIPIIQGGMGVRVSTSSLAAPVANCGCGGTIASVGLASDTPENRADVPRACRESLQAEIRRAKEMSDGAIGVNIMVALNNYEDMVRATVKENADYIISGAGMPLSLPELTEESPIKLVPIVASARGAKLLLKTWKRRYNRFPEGFVVEGPSAGGHIAGYSVDELKAIKAEMRGVLLLENAFKEVLDVVREYEKEYGVSIPVIPAGGIYSGQDIAKFLKMGAGGVQMGTRFVATCECSVSEEFKKVYLKATADDIVFIQSPVGMPAEAIKTKFLEEILRGERKKFVCQYRCLRTCEPGTVQYCIAQALMDAAEGDMENAVVFAGTNVSRIDRIVPVKELIDELVSETIEALNDD